MTLWLWWALACGGKPPPAGGANQEDSAQPQDSGGGEEGAGGGDSGPASNPACISDGSPLPAQLCASAAPCSWSGASPSSYAGYVVAGGGDFDGDGREDLAWGSPLADPSSAEGPLADAGTVTLVLGGDLAEEGGGPIGDWGGEMVAENFGTSLAFVGDVNGDGLAELLAGGRNHGDELNPGLGVARLLFGAADGELSTGASWSGERAWSRAGTAVGGPGDLDGDGLAELLITGELRSYDETTKDEEYAAGRVYLIYGHSGAWESGSLALADAYFEGSGSIEAAGISTGGGDLDGDGYADLTIGAPYGGSYKGRAYALPGGATPYAGAQALSAGVYTEGTSGYTAWGWSLAAGDLSGDGAAELVVGAPLADEGHDQAGLVVIYAGSPSFFVEGPAELARITGDWDDQQFGTGLQVGGDLNGDGRRDLLLGAVGAWQGMAPKGGRQCVLLGREEAWPASLAELDHCIYGEGPEDHLGRAAAWSDIDGDGRSEAIVGSGYADAAGEEDRGQIWLYFGG